LVTIWSTWSAHAPMALSALQRAQAWFKRRRMDVGVAMSTEPASRNPDISRILADHEIRLPMVSLSADRLRLTAAVNQIPTTLLFKNGLLVDRRLGAQSFDQLRTWASGVAQ